MGTTCGHPCPNSQHPVKAGPGAPTSLPTEGPARTKRILPLAQHLQILLVPLRNGNRSCGASARPSCPAHCPSWRGGTQDPSLTSSFIFFCSSFSFRLISSSAAFLRSTFRLWKPVRYSLPPAKQNRPAFSDRGCLPSPPPALGPASPPPLLVESHHQPPLAAARTLLVLLAAHGGPAVPPLPPASSAGRPAHLSAAPRPGQDTAADAADRLRLFPAPASGLGWTGLASSVGASGYTPLQLPPSRRFCGAAVCGEHGSVAPDLTPRDSL